MLWTLYSGKYLCIYSFEHRNDFCYDHSRLSICDDYVFCTVLPLFSYAYMCDNVLMNLSLLSAADALQIITMDVLWLIIMSLLAGSLRTETDVFVLLLMW